MVYCICDCYLSNKILFYFFLIYSYRWDQGSFASIVQRPSGFKKNIFDGNLNFLMKKILCIQIEKM